MPSAGLERMRAAGARFRAGRTEHNRRSFVMRLVGRHTRARSAGVILPAALEFLAVLVRAIAREKSRISLDAGFDEILAGLLEDRAPLFGVAREQRIAAPTLERRSKFPAEIGNVVEAVV